MTPVSAYHVPVVGVAGTKNVDDIRCLTNAVVEGDPEAFARLYRAKFNFVYRIVRATTRFDEHGSLDMVQDTMMRVIRAFKPFDDEAALDRWLACVARRVALDHLRRDRRRRMRELAAGNGRAVMVEKQVNELNERTAWLREELAGLDRASAAMVDLRYRTGLTLKAIGERVGLSPGAVHGRLLRSLRELRRRITERER